jgi:hypothetical protein
MMKPRIVGGDGPVLDRKSHPEYSGVLMVKWCPARWRFKQRAPNPVYVTNVVKHFKFVPAQRGKRRSRCWVTTFG